MIVFITVLKYKNLFLKVLLKKKTCAVFQLEIVKFEQINLQLYDTEHQPVLACKEL